MFGLLAKISRGVKHAVIGGGYWFSRLHARPENERRALFFATFIIAATLVFSFWANQMYRQFGIAFVGGPGGGPQTESPAPPAAGGNENSGGLLSPLAVFKENVLLLKEEAGNLLSGISASLRGEEFVSSPGGAGPAQKEPPSLLNGAEALTEEPETNGQPLLAVLPPKEDLPEESFERPGGDEEGGGASWSLEERPEPAEAALSGAEAALSAGKDAEARESDADDSAPSRGGEKKAGSRIVSIFKTNLAAIHQAFADFWEYLTQ